MKWSDYEPQFLKFRNLQQTREGLKRTAVLNTRVSDAVGGKELIAYTVFCEIDRDDVLWMQEYGEAMGPIVNWAKDLEQPGLAAKVKLFSVSIDLEAWEREIAENKEKDRKWAAAQRKRLSRAKKNRLTA